MNYNKIVLGGRLVAAPEVKTLPATGTELCRFRMAINSSWPTTDGKRGEEVCFVDCALFGVRAQVVRKYFGKGSNILIEGRLRHEVWDTEDNGKKVTRSKHSIVVDDFFFVDPRSKALNRERADAAAAPSTHGSVPAAPVPGAPAVPAADVTRLEADLGLTAATFDTAPRDLGVVAGRVREQQGKHLAGAV